MKLANHHKSKVVDKFKEYTFSERKKESDKTMYSLAQEYYETTYGSEMITQMNALPKGWLMEENRIWVNAGGYSITLSFPENVFVRIPVCDRHNCPAAKDPKLIHKMQKWAMETKTLQEEKSKFGFKMHSFLGNITTDAKLFAAMPEAKNILGVDFFGQSAVPCTALVTTAKEILCVVAKERGEDREGCCNGKLVEKV